MAATLLQRSLAEGALLGWLLQQAPSVKRLPVSVMTAEEVAAELQRVQARKAMEAAYEAELILALAAARPDTDDPPPGHPGARRRSAGSPVPGTSEFLPDELALVMNCGRPFATEKLSDAYQLVQRMPAVHAARRAGLLDEYRARVFAEVLGTASDEVVAAVVPAVLPAAAALSPGRLRNRLIAAAEAADEEFAERCRIEAQRRAAVRLYPTADGMSALTTEAPSAVTAAMWSTIDQAAQLARTGGDDRPIGLLRAEAHAAMVLRSWDTSRPAMTGHLTLTAPLSALHPPEDVATGPTGRADQAAADQAAADQAAADQAAADQAAADQAAADQAAAEGADRDDHPAAGGTGRVDQVAAGVDVPTLNGTPITTAHLRELLAQLGALGVQPPPGGSLTVALTDDDGALLATTTPAELTRLAA